MIAVMINGPEAGRRMELKDSHETIVFAMQNNACIHQEGFIFAQSIEYKKFKEYGNEILYKTAFDFDGNGYYCTMCKANAEARYEAKEITKRLRSEFAQSVRASINEALNDWIGEDDE